MREFYKTSGQTFVEYTLLLGIIVVILIVVNPMLRRGTEGLVKLVADQVGVQKDADQAAGKLGYIINTTMLTGTDHKKTSTYRLDQVTVDTADQEQITSDQVSNLGYSGP